MLSVLTITFPFFALVLCGYLAARRGVLPQPAIPGLNAFVLYFALPCMLYRFGASTPIGKLLDPAVAGVYVLCALVMVAGTVALTRNARIGWNDAAFGALVAAFPNTGFMGVPLLVALLGAQSAGPAIFIVLIDMVFTSSVCIALSRLDGAGAQGAGAAVRNALKGIATNPMPWSIALGAVASALQVQLPGPVDKTVAMLADAASPVALFTIGAVLARSQMNQHEQVLARDYVPVALAKLLVHPLLVALLGAQSAGPAIFVVLIDMVFTSSLCIALSRLDGAGAQGAGAAVRNALKGIATNPMPWSIALGAVASALQVQLPGPVDKTVAMLADAASPVALFTIGAVLARSQMNQHEQVLVRDYVPIALVKLLVHPLLVWSVGTAAIALGVPLTPFALTVLVLLAALPSASNVSLLAERFGAHNGRIARIILVSTALAFLSFSGAVALLT